MTNVMHNNQQSRTSPTQAEKLFFVVNKNLFSKNKTQHRLDATVTGNDSLKRRWGLAQMRKGSTLRSLIDFA
jgi:hypothetical protein